MFQPKDNSWRYLSYIIVNKLQFLVLNYRLYQDGKTCSEMEIDQSQKQALRGVSGCL